MKSTIVRRKYVVYLTYQAICPDGSQGKLNALTQEGNRVEGKLYEVCQFVVPQKCTLGVQLVWVASVAKLHTELRAKVRSLNQTKYESRLAFFGRVPRAVT